MAKTKRARGRVQARALPVGAGTRPARRPATPLFTPAPIEAAPALTWDLSDTLLAVASVLCALALYVWRLDMPHGYVFDEVYHGFTAGQLVLGNRDAFNPFATPPPNVAYEWTHPALSKLIIEIGILLFGDHEFGWRVMSALFGALGVGLIYTMGRLMFNRTVGLFAAALLLLDGLWYALSRIAMNDIFLTVFVMLAYLALFFYLREPLPRARRYLWLTGAALGLAFATKWSAGYSFGLLAAVAAGREAYWYLVRRPGGWQLPCAVVLGLFAVSTLVVFVGKGYGLAWCVAYGGVITAVLLAAIEVVDALRNPQRKLGGPAVTWAGSFIVLPAAIYLLAYGQYFIMWHDWDRFVELQNQMYYYHSHLKATHPWASRWWTWPLVLKPVWFFVKYDQNRTSDIFAMGNPLIWWAFLPAVGYGIYTWFRSGPSLLRAVSRWRPEAVFDLVDWVREHVGAVAIGLILAGFLGQWVPWALSPRVSFMYHMLPSVPFGCLAIAYALSRLRAPRLAIMAYLLPVLVVFLYFLPIASAMGLPTSARDQRFWISSWKPH